MLKPGYTDLTRTLQPNTIKEHSGTRKEQARSRARKRDRAQKAPPGDGGRLWSGGASGRPEPPDEPKLVLLPVDPYLIHAYWVISPDSLVEAELMLTKDHKRAYPILRFHDLTHVVFDGSNAHGSFDVRVDLEAHNWYVHLWSPEKSYCADLGLRTEGGRFFPLARSNVAVTPRASVSSSREACYMLVEGNYKRVGRISVGESPTNEHLIQIGKIDKRGGAPQHLKIGQATGKGVTYGPGPSSAIGLERDPAENEVRAEHGTRDSQKASSFIRFFKSSLEGKARLDLTELCEKAFVSGLSSALIHPSTGRTDR
ncbi:MAG TPA: DUF4912 domain-containing protein [Bacteroidota bacterium]|nr:DUF4912 domain-containing protein [Bacteroidota bacterium]